MYKLHDIEFPFSIFFFQIYTTLKKATLDLI
jgi:hypothetical protein